MAEQFYIDRIDIDGTEIKGFVSHSLNPAVQRVLNAGGSELDPSMVAVSGVAPVLTGVTVDVGPALAALFNAVNIPHLAFSTNCDVWFAAAAAGGSRGGALKNTRMRMTKGVVVPTTLSNGPMGVAQLGLAIYPDYDGTNPIVAFLAEQNLPAGTAGAAALWNCRALKNGTLGSVLHRLAGLNLDFGVRVQRDTPANSIYPRDTALTGFNPTLTWRTGDVATALAASGLAGAVAAAGGLILYIAQYSAAAAGVQTTGAKTLTMRAGSPWWTPGLQLTNGQLVMLDYICRGMGAAGLTNPPLAYATGVDISAVTESTSSFLYMAGPVKDNITEIEYQNCNIATGIDWEMPESASEPWPTYASIRRREPSIQVDTQDLDYIDGLPIGGKPVDTIFKAFLRKLTVDSEPIADVSIVHTLISCAAGWIEIGDVGGEHAAMISPGMLVTPTGGLALNTAIAIT